MRHLITVIVLYISVLSLQSCGGGEQKQERHFFKYNQPSGISSLDPAFARDQANMWAVNALFSGLVQLDADLNIQPNLAKNWEISEDGLTYTFHLRTDVYFHDDEGFPEGKGRKMTADDVVFSFSRLLNKSTASPGAWVLRGRLADVGALDAPDDSTFVLKLNKPFRPMLSLLTLQYTFIVPREIVDRYGRDFRIHPVGTGPFKLVAWKDGGQLIMERNDKYYETDAQGDKLPYLDGIKVYFVKSKETEYLDFIQGRIDFISGVDATTADNLLTEKGDLKPELSDKVQLFKVPYLNLEYLGFLMDSSAIDATNKATLNKKVRQAINYAIDRKQMLQYLRNGVGKPANAGVIPYGLPSFDPKVVKGYTYDPDKAMQLLKEAGYPNGDGLGTLTLHTNPGYKGLSEYIQKQLAAVGINVKLEVVPPQFQRELMTQSKASFFRASWIADYPDGESYLSLFYSANTAPPNYTRFANATYDSLYMAALNESDNNVRMQLYHEMDQLILDEAPVVPLYYDEVLRFVKKGITGIEPNAINLLDLKRAKLPN